MLCYAKPCYDGMQCSKALMYCIISEVALYWIECVRSLSFIFLILCHCDFHSLNTLNEKLAQDPTYESNKHLVQIALII